MSLFRSTELTRLTLVSTLAVGAVFACKGGLTGGDGPDGSGGQSGDGDGDVVGDGDGDEPGDGDGDTPGDGDGDTPGDGDGDGMGGATGTGGEPSTGGMPAMGGMGGDPSSVTCDGGTQDNDENGTCEADCSLVDCAGEKTCSDASGTATCVCPAGSQDNDENDTCTADCATASLSCGSGASCDDADGAAACACDLATHEMGNGGNCSSCITGELFTGAIPVTGSTVGKRDTVLSSCNINSTTSGDDLYTFTATATGTYFFNTTGSGPDFDTVLSIHEGASCSGAELKCDNDAGFSFASALRVPLAQGQVVTVAVDGFGTGEEGAYYLRALLDPCPTATDLGSDLGANLHQGSPEPGFALRAGGCAVERSRPEMYYQWTAPSTGTFLITTEGADYDTVLSVRTDCSQSSSELACDDDGGTGLLSQLEVSLTQGETVILVVGAWGAPGTNNINITAL